VSYLLDTNVVSALRAGRRGSSSVQRWVHNIADESLFVSILTFGEIRRGIEMLRGRDARQAVAIENWLVRLRDSYGERVLGIDAAVIDLWGRIGARRPYPVVDALLAATALHHGLTFVTRNIKDVADIGVDLLNPFEHG
jgi:hypothetical protein